MTNLCNLSALIFDKKAFPLLLEKEPERLLLLIEENVSTFEHMDKLIRLIENNVDAFLQADKDARILSMLYDSHNHLFTNPIKNIFEMYTNSFHKESYLIFQKIIEHLRARTGYELSLPEIDLRPDRLFPKFSVLRSFPCFKNNVRVEEMSYCDKYLLNILLQFWNRFDLQVFLVLSQSLSSSKNLKYISMMNGYVSPDLQYKEIKKKVLLSSVVCDFITSHMLLNGGFTDDHVVMLCKKIRDENILPNVVFDTIDEFDLL